MANSAAIMLKGSFSRLARPVREYRGRKRGLPVLQEDSCNTGNAEGKY